jgi:hypothetical protein
MKPDIKPLGVGDLKVVKQRLARYEPGEVAHIENVLASEHRGREHRRLRQVEEIVTLEQEREQETRRDLQSTERFELQIESQRTIKSDTSQQAGLELSAQYGPFVKLSAYGKFASTQAKEESDRNATKYAKEITDKTMSRLLERVRQERTTRTLEEVEEKNEHGFDNKDGNNITGVYRWVDKYYRLKVVNYGKRLMYEFFVPEPGTFELFATRYRYENQVLPEKPTAPLAPGTYVKGTVIRHLQASDITRTNYLLLAAEYGAEGIEPPPPECVVVSKPFSREFQPVFANVAAFSNDELEIPAGYRADYGAYIWASLAPGGGASAGKILVGVNTIDLSVAGRGLKFNGEVRSIPFSGQTTNFGALAINIQVFCQVIPEYFQRWQLNTFNAIISAYNKKLLDYEEKLAAAQIQQGVNIEGNNPDINREIERQSLKKACMTLWTAYNFDNLPGISHSPTAATPGNYPELNRINAMANATRMEFLEEAFEWNNMTYELYPYFWARKQTWLENSGVKSSDPLFERFLKAGAARVVVPVRPSSTEAVLYYQLTGIIWPGGPVPALSGISDPDVPLYNGYLKDMAGVEDVVDLDKDVTIDKDDPESYLVKVPTDLVWLQANSELPDFEK